MNKAVVAVIVVGALTWTALYYFHVIISPPPWGRWLADSIQNHGYGWFLILLIPALIWLGWASFRQTR